MRDQLNRAAALCLPLLKPALWSLGLASLLALAACGGGGGGGNDGLQVRFDKSAVSLTAEESVSPGQGAVTINASATGGSASDAVYVGAELQGVGIVVPIPVTIDTAARTASITLAPNSLLAPGTYTGTVRLLACKDPLCNAHHNGSPFNVSYSTLITPTFKATPSSLAFAAAESNLPAAQVVQVSLPVGVSVSTVALEYGAGVAPWLQLQSQGQNLSLQPQAGLSAGSYSAVLRVEAGSTRPTIRVPVEYRVSAGLVMPAALDMAIGTSTPASATRGEVALTLASGVVATQWQASSDQSWLQLPAATGSFATPLRWQIEPQAFAALPTMARYEATVTVTAPGTSLTPQTWRVRLSKEVAELQGADTVALQAGQAGEVLLYGRQFYELPFPATQVLTSGFTPQYVQVRSARVIALGVPALAAGGYDLTLATNSGLPTRSVRLVVAAAQDRPEQWVNSTGQKGALLWDAANQAAFMVDLSQSAVVRAVPVGTGVGQTLQLSSRAIPNLAGIALSPDRRAVIAATRTGQLLRLSPADLSTLSTQDLGRPLGAQFPAGLPLMVTGDQYLLATGGDQWAAPLSRDLHREADVPLDSASFSIYGGPWGLVSPNGQRALVVQSASISPAPPMLRRDALDATLTAYVPNSSPTFFYQAASDGRGDKWLLDNQRVVNFLLDTLGQFPVPLSGGFLPQAGALSRDGSRAYIFAVDSFVSNYRIDVFDTSIPAFPGGTFRLLGSFQPLLAPSCLSPTSTDTCNGYSSRMVLLDDDRTLLLAGDRRIGLVPVPQALRAATATATAQPQRAPYRLSPLAR